MLQYSAARLNFFNYGRKPKFKAAFEGNLQLPPDKRFIFFKTINKTNFAKLAKSINNLLVLFL